MTRMDEALVMSFQNQTQQLQTNQEILKNSPGMVEFDRNFDRSNSTLKFSRCFLLPRSGKNGACGGPCGDLFAG